MHAYLRTQVGNSIQVRMSGWLIVPVGVVDGESEVMHDVGDNNGRRARDARQTVHQYATGWLTNRVCSVYATSFTKLLSHVSYKSFNDMNDTHESVANRNLVYLQLSLSLSLSLSHIETLGLYFSAYFLTVAIGWPSFSQDSSKKKHFGIPTVRSSAGRMPLLTRWRPNNCAKILNTIFLQ